MKKILLFFSALAIFASCSKDGPDTATANLDLHLSYANESYNTALKDKEVTIRFKNLLNGSSTEVKQKNGLVQIPNLSPGSYDLEASITFTQEEFKQLTNEDINMATITFNASAKKVEIINNKELQLELVAGVMGDFIIKQIYYAGSDRTNGAIFRDQFFEIYNNTDQVLYADSLYFGRLWGKQTPSDTKHYFQPNGQFDWSKSADMTMGNSANTDYVYLRDLFMIPGTGKTYPIQPGESIVIAQNALNHKVPFIGNNGKEVSVKDPSLTVDLSKANFEVYYGDLPGETPFASDINNPNVPNVEVINYQGNDWLLDNLGRDSYFIFKGKTRAEVLALKSYAAPTTALPGPDATKYRQLPISWILDGVEVQPNVESSQIPKKLNAFIDAGFQVVPNGAYSSQSIIRKTDSQVGGRKILQDTNNSSNDFVSIKAEPRAFAN